MNQKIEITDILGVWDLCDWKSFKDGEFYNHPMGEDGQGQLIYTKEGRMSGFLMRADFSQEPAGSDTKSSKCLSYAGDFRIEGDEVIHDVTFSTIPEWLGTSLVRTMEMKGDQLLLKTSAAIRADGSSYTNELLWNRLQMD